MTELAASKLITIARLAIALATVCLLLGIVLPSLTFEAAVDLARFAQLAGDYRCTQRSRYWAAY